MHMDDTQLGFQECSWDFWYFIALTTTAFMAKNVFLLILSLPIPKAQDCLQKCPECYI